MAPQKNNLFNQVNNNTISAPSLISQGNPLIMAAIKFWWCENVNKKSIGSRYDGVKTKVKNVSHK